MDPYIFQKATFFQVNSPLLAYAHNVESQNGEDGILERIFEIIPAKRNFCVEFGAWDGRKLSNTFNLIESHGWQGLFIEANAQKYEALLNNHGGNPKVACLHEFVEFDGPKSLESLMQQKNVPVDFDVLSIDVDGTDYFIWESLQSFKPRVVIIEFNFSIPNDVVFVQAKDNHVNQGCSLLALVLLGKQKGYELICCTMCNAIFILSESYSELQIPSNSIWHLYMPPMDGRIFHGYDGTVFVQGMDLLWWQNISLSHDDFQVLPKSARKFGDAQSG